MFDVRIFSEILQKISNSYNSITDFSNKSEVNRTYLSKYINMKLNNPPTPKILSKIADASNGITTYKELMLICGYNKIRELNKDLFDKVLTENEWELIFGKYIKIELTDNEQTAFYKIIENLDNMKPYNNEYYQINFTSTDFTKYATSETEKNIILRIFFYLMIIFSKKLENTELYNQIIKYAKQLPPLKISSSDLIHSQFYMCPIVGKIAAGQPILAEEYIEGYLPVDPNIYGMSTSDELFYLRVSGQSMNMKVKNGDYALIHKQNYAENGDIVVAIVNGDDEATLKRYKKLNEQFVLLEPMSTDPTIEAITVDLKNTPFKIIGKAIGQFGKF